MNKPTLEDVLDAFSIEPNHGKETLEKYLQQYPQFAMDLVDLSRELLRPGQVDKSPLSHREQDRLNAAWSAHIATNPAAAAADPLAALDVAKSREFAKAFDLPRQVFTAFHERRVKVASIPRKFLSQVAAKLDMTTELLLAALSRVIAKPAHSHKSDDKPVVSDQVSFEQLLIDANVSAERRAELLSEVE